MEAAGATPTALGGKKRSVKFCDKGAAREAEERTGGAITIAPYAGYACFGYIADEVSLKNTNTSTAKAIAPTHR